MTALAQHMGARVVILVNAVAEAEQDLVVVLVFHMLDKVGDILLVADLGQHLQDCLVGAAMRRSP